MGIVTELQVKLLPIPEKAQVVMVGFDNVQQAGDSVGGIISSGIIPAGLEMMDFHAISAAEDFAKAVKRLKHYCYVKWTVQPRKCRNILKR